MFNKLDPFHPPIKRNYVTNYKVIRYADKRKLKDFIDKGDFLGYNMATLQKYSILEVMRLSDGEVFKVGDYIQPKHGHASRILEMKHERHKVRVIFEGGKEYLDKSTPIWGVKVTGFNDDFEILHTEEHTSEDITFRTKKEAQAYIRLKSECLSLEMLNSLGLPKRSDFRKKIEDCLKKIHGHV